MIFRPALALMNSNLYYLLLTPVYFFEHSDLDVLTSHLKDQLHNVSTWLKANKLSINVKKTKLMIFRPRQKTLPITRQIIIENNVLEQEDHTKFLKV